MVTGGGELGKVLKAMHFLLHDFPSRQDTYVKITETSTMPSSYCGHRWCENEDACGRASHIWQSYVKYLKYCLTLAKSKQPQGKRFAVLIKWMKDPLMEVKFKFVQYISMKLNTFLRGWEYPLGELGTHIGPLHLSVALNFNDWSSR